MISIFSKVTLQPNPHGCIKSGRVHTFLRQPFIWSAEKLDKANKIIVWLNPAVNYSFSLVFTLKEDRFS